MAERRSRYNERFLCADPLSKYSVGRSTRRWLKKKAKLAATTSTDDSLDADVSDIVMTRCRSPVFSSSDEDDLADTLQESPPVEDLPSIDEQVQCHVLNNDVNSPTDQLILVNEPDLDSNEYYVLQDRECIEETESSDDSDSFNPDVEDEVHEAEEPLFSGCPLTVTTSSVLLMQYKMRYGISDQALGDLLQLLSLHFPSPNHCISSLYLFKKQFEALKVTFKLHYFCNGCLEEFDDTAAVCPNTSCGKQISAKNKSSFIEVPLEQQLKVVVERSGVYDIIRTSSREGDIYSGKLYQDLVKTGFFSSHNELHLTLTFNTDGVPVFRSSRFSFWPLYLVINELPYKLRHRKENRLFAGLWYGSIKPDMTLFLKPMCKSLMKVYDEGILLTIAAVGSIRCRAVLLAATCDLPARAMVQNCVQYNGFYGCSHCLQSGKTFKTGVRGSVHIYPYQQSNPTGPKRTVIHMERSAQEAIDLGEPVMGVKGPSWLSRLPMYDFAEGMSYDYMHCVLLVVCRLLLRLWFNSTHHKQPWHIGKQVKAVDSLLCSFCPPDEIQRTPRPIESTVKYWKAHELRAWLLNYSPVVLKGILKEDYYQHHLLLVEGVYLLLQDDVDEAAIQQSSRLLRHYAFLFPTLYGEQLQSACIHGLMHLPEVVANLGPLWCHSCFAFEAANGEVLKWFHGSQAVEKQVIKHLTAFQQLPGIADSYLQAGSKERDFFSKLNRKGKAKRDMTAVTDGKYVVGTLRAIEFTDILADLLEKTGFSLPPDKKAVVYHKIFLSDKGRLISACVRSSKRDNSCLSYSNSRGTISYGLLKEVLLFQSNAAAVITPLTNSPDTLCCDNTTHAAIDSHIVPCFKPSDDRVSIIQVQQIQDKCVIMKLDDKVVVSHLPNSKDED